MTVLELDVFLHVARTGRTGATIFNMADALDRNAQGISMACGSLRHRYSVLSGVAQGCNRYSVRYRLSHKGRLLHAAMKAAFS